VRIHLRWRAPSSSTRHTHTARARAEPRDTRPPRRLRQRQRQPLPLLPWAPSRHSFMYNESLELTAPQHTAVKT
jgi:hypothetical protein